MPKNRKPKAYLASSVFTVPKDSKSVETHKRPKKRVKRRSNR